MESNAKAAGVIKELTTIPYNNENAFRLLTDQTRQFLARLLFLTKTVLEYCFGVYIGAAIGWVLGWYAGSCYAEHFKNLYCSDLSELAQIITQWSQIPYEFAGNGKLIGAAIGIIAIATINSKLLTHRIVSLYKKEITESIDIARVLGKNLRHIQRKINKLKKKDML